MKKYTFLVFHREYETFLQHIRDLGVVHITQKTVDPSANPDLSQALERAEEIRHLLIKGAPDQLFQEKADLEQRLIATEKQIKQLSVWGDFSSKRLAQLQESGYTLAFYSCSAKRFEDSFGLKVSQENDRVYFMQMASSPEQLPAVSDACVREVIGDKDAEQLQAEADGLKGLIVAATARIELWASQHIDALKEELKQVEETIDWQHVTLSADSLAEGSLLLMEGFCPVEKSASLNALLENEAVYYEAADPTEEDATPIQLKNNWFVRMFECLTGMYGWPNYTEFDPTPILGPFFLLFFALCIGDAGYGAMLVLVGWLIHKGKLKIAMFDGMGPIIMALGVGSTIIGYLMGGFFGINLYEAEWFPQSAKAIMFNNLGENGKIAGYDVMMVLSLLIGVGHLCLAMVVKAICFTKNKGFAATLSTWGWLLLILGSIVTLVLAMVAGFSQETTRIILISIAAVSALGIYFFNTPGRNPMINFGAGLWDTYGMVTGLLGDVLSYIRLYALGLAGGMLGAAFNQLAEMVLGETPNVGTWIGFIAIVTFGHVLNLLMACLGAFVHPLRLSFVEYFKNAGYEGHGQLYQPFAKKYK